MVLTGAIAGGFLTRDGDIADALWIAASIKVVIAIAWVFWPGKGAIRLE